MELQPLARGGILLQNSPEESAPGLFSAARQPVPRQRPPGFRTPSAAFMPRRDPRRNITRIDTLTSGGHPHRGWIVRLQRQGRYASRFFADSRWGGKRHALQAAKAFRDAVESESRYWTTSERSQVPSQRNRSGSVGVHRVRQPGEGGGKETRGGYWVAQWTDGNGHRKTRSFSVAKFGDEEARQRAQSARREGVRRSGR